MIEPTIVVIAYNREAPLQRLLQSLSNGVYPSDNITLHISIDASDTAEGISAANSQVEKVALDFKWEHGEKIVDVKNKNLGLLKHVFECGQLTEKYDSIIVLEDDLVVAPGFYQFAQQSTIFYSQDDKVAGVSLFTYPVEENNFYPFQPIQDGSDVHFIQVASSWGQSWSKNQWAKFKEWMTENPSGKESLLPDYILQWGTNSWKKLFINYLIDTDRYFVFPKTSYSSNFEEVGTHATNTGLFQVPMNLGVSEVRLKEWKDSISVYDAYFELKSQFLKRLNPSLKEFDFEVDLYGEKPIDAFDAKFVLTTKRGKNAIVSFGRKMKPLIQNAIFHLEGNEIGLYRKEDIDVTEPLRFLELSTSFVQLHKYAAIQTRRDEQVTVIMPLLDSQIHDLEVTVKGMKSDRFYNVTLLVVCSRALISQVAGILSNVPFTAQVILHESENVDELLRTGISNFGTDYCCWAQPGMIIDLKRMEDMSRLFSGMSQVQVLHGLSESFDQKDYIKLNTSKQRWTPQRANKNKDEVVQIRSEFIFWRKSLLSSDDITILTTGNLFIELMKRNLVYVLALKLGDMNGLSEVSKVSATYVSKSLASSEFQPKGGVRSLLRPLFQFWFRRNVPFFRLFYRETEQLPMVIRYDFENDNFYLDNY